MPPPPGRPRRPAGRRRRRLRLARALLARPRLALLALAAMGLLTFLAINWVVQVGRKPSELVAALGLTSPKPPRETWEAYGDLFREHATPLVPPTVLAALAQAESAGDPHARTFWRWRWSWSPLEWYRPASSGVGLYQMTDPAFQEGRRLCVREGEVRAAGAWHDLDGCWFTGLYTRLLPSHAVELTAARLHVEVARLLAGPPAVRTDPGQRRDLAAVVHLCGSARGAGFVRRGFRPSPGERCGSHDLAGYLARVRSLTRTFARLAAGGTGDRPGRPHPDPVLAGLRRTAP